MRIDMPGLWRETLPSGAHRYRITVAGSRRKITLRISPDHPKFAEHYHAARRGILLEVEAEAPTIRGSMAWLIGQYCDAMAAMLESDQLQAGTVKQRTVFLKWVASEVGEYAANMPAAELLKLRDKRAQTPGAADNMVKAVRAMYQWGEARGLVTSNPAKGIGKINNGKGARPWSLDDLTKYRERHPQGTMAHLALSLFMFTAGRIGDVYQFGRRDETTRDGQTWLDWQPAKRGSTRVTIPMLPPLFKATRAAKVVGATYLLTDHGRPFASEAAFGNKFRDWIAQAGLAGLSSHGIRKAAGELLALHGATQYHIMAIHGHTSAKTSEIYTQGANRAALASQGMQLLAAMEW